MLRLFFSIIIIISVAKFAYSGNHLKCGKNEILTKCENRVCEYRKCSDVGQSIECEKVDRKNCIKGCICRNNYLRANNGTCIPADQCPPSCSKNEIPTSCIEEINERRSCSDLSEPVSCVEVDQQFCTDGCLCEDGYLRDCNGICILIDECPEAQCGDNEEFDLCPPTCPGEECEVDPSTVFCLSNPKPGSPSCQPSCRCCDGYRRNTDGCCIPEDSCPTMCGDNEIPTACIQLRCERRSCSDIPEPVACVRVNPLFCTNGCLCKDGYLKAENGTCIPMDQCPEAQCGDNEIFDPCPATCPGEECGVDPSLVNCLPSPEPGSPSCQPSCRCCDGYRRNEDGCCIPEEECPIICGENEQTTTCIQAICERRDCSDILEPVACVRVNTQFCTEGCLCMDGYLRAENGTCIPIDQCPEAQCGDNEIFDLCPATCPGEECGADPSLVNCLPSPEPGSPSCQPSCRCCDGYRINEDGCCIPEEECPIICGDNEIPTACIQLRCERRNCSDIPEPVACVRVNPQFCTDGCLCTDGYLRAENGTCIPMDQCPEAQCGDDEIFDPCPATCPGEECGVDPSLVNCLPSPEPGSPSCQPSCRCCDGYRRNEDGCCIPEEECPIICGDNEQTTTCIQAMCERRDCSDILEPVACVRVNTQFCTEGCLCMDGYLRAENGTCIPIDQCPEAQCGDNEIFDLCPATCPGEECGVDPSLVNCLPSPEPGSPSCQPSCRCCDGYRRNEDNCCIPEEECPPTFICAPDEEYNSCVNGNYCGRRNCSQPGIICINLIEGGCIEGCQCKEGLLRADNGTCIPEDQCPPNCFGENEVAGCQRNCPPQTCESIGRMYKCPVQTKECIQECRCITGYYGNAIGECVSRADCLKCTGPNEYFSCGVACDNICATLAVQNQTNCPIDNIVCNPMCYCLEGYARDSNNICIPISKCPPSQPLNEVECGPNAVYDSTCTESCPECPPQDCDICLQVLCEPIQDPPGCRCIENYLRNRKGLCVPSEQCEAIPKRRPSKRRNEIVSSIRG